MDATPDSTIPTKRCSKCGVIRTLDCFTRDNQKSDGLRSSCRACESDASKARRAKRTLEQIEHQRAYQKQWAENNRDRINASARRRYPYRREYQRAWISENRHKSRAYSRKSRLKHLEKRRAEDREFAKAHRADRIAYNRTWRAKNPDKQREISRRHDEKHKEKRRAKARAWRKTESGKLHHRASTEKRRALLRGSSEHHTAEDIKRKLRNQKGRCWWCGKAVGDNYHIDHIIPLSKGGDNSARNICIACQHCNNSKHNKLPSEWGGRLF